ncbi:MAG: bifunctional 4-hydroxy-2-oxoglutarate aldolase/2-dehydro-3-deoxy-phosphogluconate aldolase [Bacteroidetes bacterium]|nr:MAG: bifunctional 4-hydroxy-2-oxoglutarate aldolase/2-dehydro-3-deoxy-phosphogluconate aldolase [Bacteroidota bacterium]
MVEQRNNILQQLGAIKIIPVVVIENEESAEPLAEALLEGGLPTMEITFRTAAAQNAITMVVDKYPNMLVGAGTVLSIEQVKAASSSGAKYIVSPGFNRDVVEYCLKNDIPVTPGVLTPTEIETALNMGLQVVKFFPAEAIGGVKYLKAISAPYKNIKFIPTGGINESNVASYLSLPQVHACGGSWMVKSELIKARRFGEIRELTKRAKQLLGTV